MAAPVPKPKELRRNRTPPQRGEWVELEEPTEPVLPPYDREKMTVPERLWNAWRICPPATQYDDGDRATIYELAVTWQDRTFADRDRVMTWLGLNPKGKRDLRWRTPNEVKTIKKAEEKKASVHRLRAVGDDK